jgi:hypothetical protein
MTLKGRGFTAYSIQNTMKYNNNIYIGTVPLFASQKADNIKGIKNIIIPPLLHV